MVPTAPAILGRAYTLHDIRRRAMSDAELSPRRMERPDASGHTDMTTSARPTAGSSEGRTPTEASYSLDDGQDTGPTVAAGRWLGEEDLWLASGSQWAVRPS